MFSPPKPENSFDENGRFIGQIIAKASGNRMIAFQTFVVFVVLICS